ncbi:MAG TPA: hypothetical protein PK335_13100 [Draconibacterium sp.]|nr:hypothetical protein [Draconibacterium sp.]
MRKYVVLILFILLYSGVIAQDEVQNFIKTLPEISGVYEKGVKEDWLVTNVKLKSGLFRTADNSEIVLSNGILSRSIKISPNAATVSLKNLQTKQEYLRGVKPEAIVEIDGIKYDVGGLVGQQNYAFLTTEDKNGLKSSLNSFRLTNIEVGSPKPVMHWNTVRHHAPDTEWPPKGVRLQMDYSLPEMSIDYLLKNSIESGLGRKTIINENFDNKLEGWKIHVSPSHERSSLENEGKPGEIYTPANSSVYMEKQLNEEVGLVEATIFSGTDNSGEYGPGIVLVFKDKMVKINIKPGGDDRNSNPTLGVYDGERNVRGVGNGHEFDFNNPYSLRIRLEEDTIFYEGRNQKEGWMLFHRSKKDKSWGIPVAVRFGKTNQSGEGKDDENPGELVRLHIQGVSVYGKYDKAEVEKLKVYADNLRNVTVSVNYELYDGIPVLRKWLTVKNNTSKPITINSFVSEILAAVEYTSFVDFHNKLIPNPNVHVETDYAFGGMSLMNSTAHSVKWLFDEQFVTQVNYARKTPCLLNVSPEIGPDAAVEAGGTFESFNAYIMPFDNYERQRNGLSLAKMYKIIAPWTTENPLMMHARFSDWESVKKAIDQCSEVGFEMVILTFGSGFDVEKDDPEYLAEMKKYRDYAKSKGIDLGGYSLLASRRIDDENDVINPKTGKTGGFATFGNSPCLCSEWGNNYFDKLYHFYNETGFSVFEHDGSYPGDVCASTTHPGHKGLSDSQYMQWKKLSDFYKWCRGKDIFLNVPDYWFLSGSNKTGMGYRETNWSLPREQQVIHVRQNIFDGTHLKLPSMGWMFVPLTEYHGGGAAATIEPLSEHLHHYDLMMKSNLGFGVQACYRGPRLFDTDATKQMVKANVDWYKKYRDILESPLLQLKRANAIDVDYMMHVNPTLKQKGLVMIFNPKNTDVTEKITLPLYYTGLTETANIRQEEGKLKTYKISRDYNVEIEVPVKANSYTWLVVE